MENFILILLCIAIGYGLKRLNIFSKDAATTLNQYVIYISLPAMILLQIPKLTFSMDTLIPIVVSWGVMSISVVLVILLARFLNFSREVTGSLLLVAILSNSSFLGIPILNAYIGQSALPYVLVYDHWVLLSL